MGNVTHSYELIGNIGDLPGVDIVKFELLGVKIRELFLIETNEKSAYVAKNFCSNNEYN